MGPEIAIYLERYKSVYIEIPKVACTSIKTRLAELLNVELERGNPHQTKFPSVDFELTERGPLYPGLFSFAFVRNPWDRLVSCYRDKICLAVDGFTESTIRPGVADCLARFDSFQPKMPFAAFVEAVATIPDEEADTHFRSQYTFVSNLSRETAVEYVGRYESIIDDLHHIQRMSGVPLVSIPRLQAAPSVVRYRDYYDARSRDRVADRFHIDREMFGYEF